MTTRPRPNAPHPSRRAPRWLTAAGVGALLLVPATASAAPLNETEPNDSPLNANGPIPGDGYTSTIGVRGDVDYFRLRLAGRQQIRATITALQNKSCRWQIIDANGKPVTSDGFTGGAGTVLSTSWTTPRDASEYIGSVSGDDGCSALVKVEPASAIITGPLPTPDYGRTLSSSAPSTAAKGAAVPVAASGVAADEDQVKVQWRTGGCPTTPMADSAGGTIYQSPLLAAGAFNVSVPTTAPSVRSTATLCTWLIDSLGTLQPLNRQQTVQVDPVAGPTAPATPAPPTGGQRAPAGAIISSKRLRRGAVVRAHVYRLSGKVQFRFYRRGKLVRRVSPTIRGITATASTRRLARGRYRVSVWNGSTRLAAMYVRIVK